MMKVNITHQDKFVSFEIESNLPEREAFGVLRAFTVSAFGNIEEPLTFVLSGSDPSFLLQGPKDWKEGMQKHFKGVVNLSLLSPDDNSDSEDSFCVITEDGEVAEKEQEKESQPPQKPELAEDLKSVEVINDDDQGVIEDYNENDELVEDKQSKEEVIEGKPQQKQPQLPCQRMKQRVMQFIADLGTENVQNVVAVVHMLLTEGCQLGDAIRTALDSSEAVSEHPFVKEFLPHLDMFVAQAGVFTKTLVPFITQINVDGIIAMIPNIVDSITRALSGDQDVELDVGPIFQMMNPQMMQHMQNLIPNGQERVFSCNSFNPFQVIQEAQEAVEQEFQPEEPAAVHRGITCDVCDMSPIVGVRFKSVRTANYDLCEACEPNHDPNDPLIKIKTPIGDMNLLPGLGEFSRAVGGHAFRRAGPFQGRCGRRRGRGRGRRGGRCGFGRRNRGGCHPFAKVMKEMMAQEGGCREKIQEMMQNGQCPMMRRFCNMQQQNNEDNQAEEPQQLAEEFRADPARALAAEQAEQARIVAEKQQRLEEIEKKKVELAERKFQLSALRESMKKSKQELKAMKKEDKKQQLKFKEILKQTEKAKQLTKSTQPKCNEVTHLDLAEVAVLKPGTSQLKTWKVKNTGKTLWDDNTVAEFTKGNKSMIVHGFEKVHVGSVEPGHVAYIRVMLNIPEEAGDYSVTYRLSAPVSGKFGKPLRSSVSVEAVDAEPVFAESPMHSAIRDDIDERTSMLNSLPALIEDDDEAIDDIAEQVVEPVQVNEPAFQYAEGLKALLEFGFDEETSKNVLIANEGNVEASVNMLLA